MSMANYEVHTLDLNFMGVAGAIACYLIQYDHGSMLIECGPGSTIAALQDGLERCGLTPADISDVFLTHIHLDHAGAAGWLADHGAQIHVHPVGAPHMQNPEKLLASAARIYGDQMETLWGKFLPVPAEKLSVLRDEEIVELNGISVQAIDTPGHAEHHYAYLIDNICFSGDIGGVRLGGTNHIRIPMPPPELHLGKWRQSLERLKKIKFSRIAPTHFGIFDDPDRHLSSLEKALDQTEEWIETIMPSDPEVEEINQRFITWSRQRAIADGVSSKQINAYESANPSWMSGYGIQRYWRKYRSEAAA